MHEAASRRPAVDVLTITTPSGEELTFEPRRLVVAGYTGRDRAAVDRHIRELADAGIAPPARTPTYFELPPQLASCDDTMTVAGEHTSGEVEPVLLFTEAGPLLTVGSDHTDRDIEREDITASKAACPKLISSQALDYRSTVDNWDECSLRCWADGATYQQGALAAITPPPAIVQDFEATVGAPEPGLVLFLGTIPLATPGFRFASSYRMALTTPSGGSTQLEYRVLRRN